MVERRPSKPHGWVRFLLPLNIAFFCKNLLRKERITATKNKKLRNKHFLQNNYLTKTSNNNFYFFRKHLFNLFSIKRVFKNKKPLFKKVIKSGVKWTVHNTPMVFFVKKLQSLKKELHAIKKARNFKELKEFKKNRYKITLNIIPHRVVTKPLFYKTKFYKHNTSRTKQLQSSLPINGYFDSQTTPYFSFFFLRDFIKKIPQLTNTLFSQEAFYQNFTHKTLKGFDQLVRFLSNNDLPVKGFLLNLDLNLSSLKFTFTNNRVRVTNRLINPSAKLRSRLILPVRPYYFSIKKSSRINFYFTARFYRKYYTYIEYLTFLNKSRQKRSLYSHVYSNTQLKGKFLLFLRSNTNLIPLKTVFYGNNTAFRNNITKSLANLFEYQFQDNFLESFYSNTHKLTSLALDIQKKIHYSDDRPLRLFSKSGLDTDSVTSRNVPFSYETLFTFSNLKASKLLNNNNLFKFFFWNYLFLDKYSRRVLPSSDSFHSFFTQFFSSNFSTRIKFFSNTNIIPLSIFKYTVRRRVVKLFNNSIFVPKTTGFFYKTLVNFIEFFSGKKVFIKFDSTIEHSLTYSDHARCYMWFNRVLGFQRILGHRIFVHESLRIFHIAIRYRDPTFLANWIKAMLYRMSFWKYRVLLRYVKFVLRDLFLGAFSDLDFKGVQLTLKGKVSVAGNARTRTVSYSIGSTSHSNFNNRVLSHFTNLHSFTGVMGFRLTFYF